MELNSLVNVKIETDSGQKSKKIVDDLKKIEKGNDKLQKELKETSKVSAESGARIAKSTGEVDKRFKKMAKSAKSANDSIHGLSGGAKSLKTSFSGFAKLGIASAIAAIGIAVLGTAAKFKEFDQSIANLSAITGATGKDLEFYSDKAREMGKVTTLSASEVAQAFQLVASAKPDLLSSKEALALVTAEAITLAEAAGISVPEAANTMASALNQFGAEADQAARFTNVLAAGSKFGAASIAEMGESLKFAGVVSSTFKLSFEETNAALQIFSTNAIKGGEAGTQLRGVLLALETKMSDEFKPSVVGLEKALQNLGEANLTSAEKVKLFGNRNLVAGEILVKSVQAIDGNASALATLTENITGTSIAQEQAATKTDTLDGAMKRLGSAAEELSLVMSVDTGLGRALTFLVDGLAAFVNGISFAVGGVIDLTKFLWDLSGAGEFLSETFGGAAVSSKDFFDNLDIVRILVGGEMVKGFLFLGQTVETVFEVISNEVNKVKNNILSMMKVLVDLAKIGGKAFDKMFGTGAAKKIEKFGKEIDDLRSPTKSLGDVVKDTAKKYDELRLEVDKSTEAAIEFRDAGEEAASTTEDLKDEVELAAEELDGLSDSLQDVLDKLDEEIAAVGRTNEEQKLYNALKDAGVAANTAEGRSIQRKVMELRIEQQNLEWINEIKDISIKKSGEAEKAAVKSAENSAKAATEAAKETEKAWLEGRDGMTDFFVDMAQNGSDAFSGILDGFKNMLIKMAAQAASNGIMQLLFGGGGAVGGSILSQGASLLSGGGGGLSSLISGGSSVSSLFSGGISGIGTSISSLGVNGFNALSGLGTTGTSVAQGIAGVGQNVNGLFGSTGNLGADFVTGGIATAGAGIAGNFLGNAVFGDSKNGSTGGSIGAVVGGVVGSIIPVIGTALGAAIGGFLGNGIGSLIGGKSNNSAISEFDFGTGQISSRGVGEFDQKNLDAVDSIVLALKDFSDVLGGSSFSGKVRVGNVSGFKLDGEKFDSALELVEAGMDKIIKSSEALTPAMKTLALEFEGSAQELLPFVSNLRAISELTESNNVKQIVEDFNSAMIESEKIAELSGNSLMSVYRTQLSAVKDITVAYDGTALATETLAAGLLATKQAAGALAIGVLQLQQSLGNLLEGSAQSIRDSVKTEKEVLSDARTERNQLRQSLRSLTSPEEIQQAATEIARLNRVLFDALSEEQQLVNAEKFASFVDRTNEIAQSQLSKVLNELSRSQDRINADARRAMRETADKTAASANTFLDAAELITRAANVLANSLSSGSSFSPRVVGEV